LRLLFGRLWCDTYLRKYAKEYDRLVRPIRPRVLKALRSAGDLDSTARQWLVRSLSGMLMATDLQPLFRVEFLLNEARIYLAGHIPCGWSGPALHTGEFAAY